MSEVLQYWQLPRGEWFAMANKQGYLLKLSDTVYAEFSAKDASVAPCVNEDGSLLDLEVERMPRPQTRWWQNRGTSLAAKLEDAMFYDEVAEFKLHDDPYGEELKKSVKNIVVETKPEVKKKEKKEKKTFQPLDFESEKWEKPLKAMWPSASVKEIAAQAAEADAKIFEEIAKAKPAPSVEDDRWGDLMV